MSRCPTLATLQRAMPQLAARAKRHLAARRFQPRRLRVERFGAIAQLVTPRALVFVDRQFARSLGVAVSSLWQGSDDDASMSAAPLSAPLEAHLQLTNRCDAGCRGCQSGGHVGPAQASDLSSGAGAQEETARGV